MLLQEIVVASVLEPKHLALGLSVTTLVAIALVRTRYSISEIVAKVLSAILNVRGTQVS
jgi:hypothetical protein